MATTGVNKMFVCCWIIVFINTLFIVSTPENVYLDKNILILGGLEAEILTRIQIWSAIFKMATTGVNKKFGSKIFCFVTSGL